MTDRHPAGAGVSPGGAADQPRGMGRSVGGTSSAGGNAAAPGAYGGHGGGGGGGPSIGIFRSNADPDIDVGRYTLGDGGAGGGGPGNGGANGRRANVQ